MAAPVPPLPSEEVWGDLLDGLPDVGLLDDMQVDCLLGDAVLTPCLDPLDGLDLGLDPTDAALLGAGAASAGSLPASSDLLESLQLDATPFAEPAGSSGAGHSPSGSGTDSPVAMLGAPLQPPLSAAAQQLVSVGAGPSRASPATSESENDGQPRRGQSPSGSQTMANGAAAWPAGSGASGAAAHAAQQQEQQHSEPMLASRHNLTEEEKRLARMQRNRENAQLSRQRKKQQMAELEARCATLGQQNTKLTAAVQRLTAENAMLRQQLALICQQAGRNAAAAQKAGTAAKPGVAAAAAKPAKPATTSPPQPAAPAAVKPATAPAAEAGKPAAAAAPTARPAAQPATQAAAVARHAAHPAAAAAAAGPAASATAAAAAAVAARGLLPQWPLLPFGFLPKVARPGQLQAIRPGAAKPAPAQQRLAAPAQAASAAAAQKSAPAAQAGSAAAAPAGARAPKRARTAAGASTAFLALFTLFMFAGPLAPAPGTSSSAGSIASAGTGAQRSLQALPEAALLPSTDLGLRHTGRGLQALPSAPSADPSGGQLQRVQHGPLPQHPALPEADALLSPAAGGRSLQQLLNSTLQALLLEPGNAALEAAALQRLQELGPVALLLDADALGAPPGATPLAASAAFPTLAGQLFGSAGLEAPQMCQKVLEFDAASVPHAARSRRSLERYVLGATGFRGRSLGAGAAPATAVALPAAASDAARTSRHSQRLQQAQQALRISEDDGPDEEAGEADTVQHAGPAGDAVLPAGSTSEGPVLVSILLPANASGGSSANASGGHKLSAVDKVFVVLLHPAERYTTYSCALPRPVVL